jgi:hypothetical protein
VRCGEGSRRAALQQGNSIEQNDTAQTPRPLGLCCDVVSLLSVEILARRGEITRSRFSFLDMDVFL